VDRVASRPGLGIGIGLAVGTTALSGVNLAIGATWLQWLAIASLLLLGEGILLAILAYRGPRVPRTRVWPGMTALDAYVFEEGWYQQYQEEGSRQQPQTEGRISRRWLHMALPPLVFGAILFVLSASL
jgi:hypothetical protein